MLNFCTLFDSNYLSRGLAMYQSLSRHCKDFHLYVFAFDNKAFEVLQKLNLLNTTIVSLKQFEDEELLKVKKERSEIEYLWTCSSSVILYVLENYKVDNCTYLDADIYFFNSPKVLIDEIGNNSVIVTKHRYTPKYDFSAISGIYCVQFMLFRNDETGKKVLKWWRNTCIDSCYIDKKSGKCGDQKYLDGWTERFSGIHVLQHLGGGVAPWNIQQYDFYLKSTQLFGREKKTKKEFKVIFYHFQDFKFLNNNKVGIGGYDTSKDVINIFYKPYLKQLVKIRKDIFLVDNSFDPHGTANIIRRKKNLGKPKKNLRTLLGLIKRKIMGIKSDQNIYDISNLGSEPLWRKL